MTAFEDPGMTERGDDARADSDRADPPHGGKAEVTQVSDPADAPGSVGLAKRQRAPGPLDGPGPNGPIERFMSLVIRKLAWSRLSDPKVAISVSAVGLLLSMFIGATAHNQMTLPAQLPLTRLFSGAFPALHNLMADHPIFTGAVLYTADILACLGLAGMLWAYSQGWRPDPKRLFLVSTGIVAVMVSLTPVGSSDTASYAAYGRIAAQGGNPYTTNPCGWLYGHNASLACSNPRTLDRIHGALVVQHSFVHYYQTIGVLWKTQPSVYGPVATVIQRFAAMLGGANVAHTIWALMILNGLVFVGVGFLLLKTSADPVRATLFWTANPVIIQQLVSGGHSDTYVAAAAICAIQLARRVHGKWGDVLIGLLIGLACGVKATAALIGLGLAWPLLMRREWMRTARITAVALVTVGVIYSFYGFTALKPLQQGSSWVELPSPWWFVQALGHGVGISDHAMGTIISVLWPIAMIAVAWVIYRRISSDEPREVVAPFAIFFAWVLVAPWTMAWYTAIAWVTLAEVPRNRMTRWLVIVTVVLAIWHSSGGQPLPPRP
jgi:hypothetical protein